MEPEPRQHSVRRIVLPSGRKIDVVRFPERTGRKHAGLHVCPECESHLVQPVSWTEAAAGHWQLELYCPNCDWAGSGVYDQQQIERFEDMLESGVESILDDLKRLTYANMTADVERFIAALNADFIVPEDF